MGPPPFNTAMAPNVLERGLPLPMTSLRLLLPIVIIPLGGCDALGAIVVEAGDFAGAKADVHCDRREVTGDGKPAAFCQEVLSTVAAAEFSDDCRAKHKAKAAPGPCPRPRVIAGCTLHTDNEDDSKVIDWYYEVDVDIEGRAADIADVARTCSDRERYEDGAELITP